MKKPHHNCGTLTALESLAKPPQAQSPSKAPWTRQGLSEDVIRAIVREEMKVLLEIPGVAREVRKAKLKVRATGKDGK